MGWKLWIDDDTYTPNIEAWRKPPEGETDWRVARNSTEALIAVMAYGIPEFIDFDHDLGYDSGGNCNDTAMRFLQWLFEMEPNAILEIKDYRIHSANPEGAKNIHAYMDSWRRSMEM